MKENNTHTAAFGDLKISPSTEFDKETEIQAMKLIKTLKQGSKYTALIAIEKLILKAGLNNKDGNMEAADRLLKEIRKNY